MTSLEKEAVVACAGRSEAFRLGILIGLSVRLRHFALDLARLRLSGQILHLLGG